jgi:hypothetical protein
MTNDKQIDKCRTFSCNHELYEDCIDTLGKAIDELAQEGYSLQCAATERERLERRSRNREEIEERERREIIISRIKRRRED